jgi:hypothetical protein
MHCLSWSPAQYTHKRPLGHNSKTEGRCASNLVISETKWWDFTALYIVKARSLILRDHQIWHYTIFVVQLCQSALYVFTAQMANLNELKKTDHCSHCSRDNSNFRGGLKSVIG